MKQQICKNWGEPPQLKSWDLMLFFIPLALWLTLLRTRPIWMDLHCAVQPSPCTPDSVFWPDRWSLLMTESPKADHWSFLTQNLSAWLAAIVPLIWDTGIILTQALRPLRGLVVFSTDLLMIAESIILNGFMNEVARLLVQRPRPFVYADPLRHGPDPAHYTSFYSGHTSFVACTWTAIFLCLLGRRAPRPVLLMIGSVGFTMTLLTGVFRVMALRHFPSDVAFGAFAGAAAALIISKIHKPRSALNLLGSIKDERSTASLK